MQHSAVRVNTRCLRRSVRPCGALGLPGAPRGCGDLGLHSPPGSDATMMQLIPLRGVHHRCACWHRDASGSSRLHRAHHRQVPASGAGRHRSCEGRAGPPHHWPRSRARPGNQPLWLHRDASRARRRTSRGRQLARQPRGTPTRRCAADVAGTHRSRRPARRSWPGPCDTAGQIRTGNSPTSGVTSRRPAPAEVFSMVRNPLPTKGRPVPGRILMPGDKDREPACDQAFRRGAGDGNRTRAISLGICAVRACHMA